MRTRNADTLPVSHYWGLIKDIDRRQKLELATMIMESLRDEELTPDAKHHPTSPIAHTPKEMKAIVEERLRLMESGQATYVDGDEVFTQIRTRYGFEG